MIKLDCVKYQVLDDYGFNSNIKTYVNEDVRDLADINLWSVVEMVVKYHVKSPVYMRLWTKEFEPYD
jgi:hypothetical protein